MAISAYHGKNAVIYVSTTGTGVATTVGGVAKWSLDMKTDKVDVTCFGDTNKAYVQGLRDVQGTLSGFWDSAADTLYDAAASIDGCKLYIYPSAAATGKFFSGPAYLDFSAEAGADGAVTINCSFAAAGAWAQA